MDVPATKIKGPVLVAGSGRDEVWDSGPAVKRIAAELRDSHFPYRHRALYFAKAGDPELHARSAAPLAGRALQGAEQVVRFVGLVVAQFVDVEGRGPVHAAAHAAHEVVANAFRVDVVGQLLVEAIEIEAYLLGVAAQLLVAQALLVLVEHVVHLPELALGARRLGRLGGGLGARVLGGDRGGAEHEAQPVAHPRLHFLDDRIRGTAVRALVVAVLDQRDRRVRRSLDVVAAFADGDSQPGFPGRACHDASPPRSSRAWRMPSAPGLTPTGDTKLQRTTPSPSMTNS